MGKRTSSASLSRSPRPMTISWRKRACLVESSASHSVRESREPWQQFLASILFFWCRTIIMPSFPKYSVGFSLVVARFIFGKTWGVVAPWCNLPMPCGFPLQRWARVWRSIQWCAPGSWRRFGLEVHRPIVRYRKNRFVFSCCTKLLATSMSYLKYHI